MTNKDNLVYMNDHCPKSIEERKEFQNRYCDIYRLSDIRENAFGEDEFVKMFGAMYAGFSIYYEDLSKNYKEDSFVLHGSNNMDEWNAVLSGMIDKYGDIRACFARKGYDYPKTATGTYADLAIKKPVCYLTHDGVTVTFYKDFTRIQRFFLKHLLGFEYSKSIS